MTRRGKREAKPRLVTAVFSEVEYTSSSIHKTIVGNKLQARNILPKKKGWWSPSDKMNANVKKTEKDRHDRQPQ